MVVCSFFVYAVWEMFYLSHRAKSEQTRRMKNALELCSACKGVEIDSEATVDGDVKKRFQFCQSCLGNSIDEI